MIPELESEVSIKVFGEVDLEALNQIKEAVKYEGKFAALMADHHIGYSIPIGGVIAYENRICINGVGYDIACGNKAVRVNASKDQVISDIYGTMNEVQKHISFGVGRTNKEVIQHELFDEEVWNEVPLLSQLKDKAVQQLGTVGSGNHYVDIFTDDSDSIWIGCHFGSRGLGHSIATWFINAAGGKDGIHAKPVVLHEDSDLGQQYIKCMQLAGRYAYAGRDWVCSRVARLLQADILEEIHNHHNFAWQETHNDKQYWVVRKGATPNWPGTLSFVGGTMGDFSYILAGVESQENKDALYSTVHGAGRIMGRTVAKGKFHNKTGEQLSPGAVSPQDMQAWISKFGVELRGGDVDESPHCYKRIEAVLHAHRESIKVIHRLRPLGVCMADKQLISTWVDKNNYDPHKD